MTTRLSHRIELLERRHLLARGPHVCPECGNGSTEHEFIVEHGDQIDDGPDYCTTCGRHIRFRIQFDQRG